MNNGYSTIEKNSKENRGYRMNKNAKFYIGVKALIMNDKNEVLLLKAAPSETKFEKKQTDAFGRLKHVEFWDFPGGRVKEKSDAKGVSYSETLENTLKTECLEEISIKKIEIVKIFSAVISNFMIKDSFDEKSPLALIVYNCKTDLNNKIKLSHEHTEYKWFAIKEAKKLLETKYPKSFVEKLDEVKK